MQPINLRDDLHKVLKIQAIANDSKMYELAAKYVIMGLWVDSLPIEQQHEILEQVNQFRLQLGIDE